VVEAAPEADPLAGAAFYCVVEERYFLGAVGLVNSLRLVGHAEPVYLLDCGLSAEQRALLAPHARLVPWSGEAPALLLEALAPLRHPAEVMVLIDADMIVTRPLTELVERAADGAVVAVENDRPRHCPEWGELLGLGPVRRQPYVSSGLVAVGEELGRELLGLMERLQDRVDFEQTFWRRNLRRYPFRFADQDVLNAILAARLPRERTVVLEHRLAPTPPFRGLRVAEEATLRCRYRDGVEPYAIHQYIRKPWLEPVYHGVYSRLLARLLVGDGLTVRVPEAEVPIRLRSGPGSSLRRGLVNVRDYPRWRFGDPVIDAVPELVKDRLEAIRLRAERGR
jgi:hypothetical protein